MRSSNPYLFASFIAAVFAAPQASSPNCLTWGNFPDPGQWRDFETLWNINAPAMGNTPDEMTNIKNDIQSIAGQNVDPRLALAIMMRESTGQTKQPCGDLKSGNPACGLFQNKDKRSPDDPNRVPTCESTQPCPADKIKYMIQCGIQGCGNGFSNINDCLNNQEHGKWPEATRCYNTGSIPDPQNLKAITVKGQEWGVPLYPMDIGNILMGLTTDVVYSQCQQG